MTQTGAATTAPTPSLPLSLVTNSSYLYTKHTISENS